ncbi:MAG: YibE/F-like protein [Parcubacteria group bacterium GW2011_GWE2_39_37]|nr:MAG: YibE/F-like protein [Parcubacteria group bacterium GW2011_GWE2_39_37]
MKKIIFTIIGLMLLLPIGISAQGQTAADRIFKAEVTEIVREIDNVLPDGSTSRQQDLKLKGLEGEFKDKTVDFKGISNVDVIKKNLYKVGEKVLVLASVDDAGNYTFYVTDHVRTNTLLLLVGLFVAIIFIVGGWKGLRSIISLALTFVVIMKYIVPQILQGSDPVIVTIIGSLLILLCVIYLTEGFNIRSHLGITSIFISLIITITLSWLFVAAAKLSGISSEETSFLVGVSKYAINFKGLLLAGIIIGALGVLDDVVVSQIATVEEINKTDPYLDRWELYKRGFKVGVSHISSMTNTLFLAYAGASLSLLILFSSGQSGTTGWGQAVNNEMMATEIVRTLAGSIGLILAVPISTFIATWWWKRRRKV